jgi:hypothetical protein
MLFCGGRGVRNKSSCKSASHEKNFDPLGEHRPCLSHKPAFERSNLRQPRYDQPAAKRQIAGSCAAFRPLLLRRGMSIIERASPTPACPPLQEGEGRLGGFHSLIDAIERSKIEVPELSAAALCDVLRGGITGEGPTTTGRAHFSRALDPHDASLCARILNAAGGEAGAPVSQLEVNVLFDIDAVAAERTDSGRFDDLLVKSGDGTVLVDQPLDRYRWREPGLDRVPVAQQEASEVDRDENFGFF